MTAKNINPQFDAIEVKSLVATHFSLDCQVKTLPSYIDLNFLLTADDGQKYVAKIANAQEPLLELEMQNAAMDFLQQQDLGTLVLPRVLPSNAGQKITSLVRGKQTFYFRLLSFVPGNFYVDVKPQTIELRANLAKAIAHLNKAMLAFNHPASGRYLIWDLKQASNVIRRFKDAIVEKSKLAQVETILALFETRVLPTAHQLPIQVIHNDANDYNVLVDDQQNIIGLIDFGDMVESYRINDLAIAITYALLDQENPVQIIADMACAYHHVNPLQEAEIEVLFYLVIARLAVSVCNSSVAFANNPDNDYLLVSAKPAWQAIEHLLARDHAGNVMKIKAACGLLTSASNQDEIKHYRQQHLSKTLSLSYQQPLKIVLGSGAYLYDEQGNAYLDMVNNVCHVGHCHPKVVAAGQKQMATLNTNTRFLHDNIVQYGKALLATFPEPLSVVFFVNSGSEANELAMRLVKAHTASDNMIVVEGAYHGNTNKAIEISPYKFDGPGGLGKADNIQVVPMPDPFRGEFKGHSEQSGRQYAKYVEKCVAELGEKKRQLGGFICESLQGVGGNLVMPDGYLKQAYQAVRAAGGLCLADEVQVGFGRVGSHWWGFETQGVVPDIVTIGKPIGNGHPLAAVITTAEVAASFETGMEYFNTFGGNPVSCAIGLAVLDVIKTEQLRENAQSTGDYFKAQLQQLAGQYPCIGDVRGLGLFIGVELVKCRETQHPDTELAKACVEQLKKRGILLSLDGPYGNVFKIKPPIVFGKQEVDFFITQLCHVFEQLNVARF